MAKREPSRQFLLIKFEIDQDQVPLAESEIHDMGERIVAVLVTDEPVTFDSTEVISTATRPPRP